MENTGMSMGTLYSAFSSCSGRAAGAGASTTDRGSPATPYPEGFAAGDSDTVTQPCAMLLVSLQDPSR